MEPTFLQGFIQAANLRRWLSRPDRPSTVQALKICYDKLLGFREDRVDPNRSDALIDTPPDLRRLTGVARLFLQARVTHLGIVYSRSSTHHGNSTIMFYSNGNTSSRASGTIKYIYQSGGGVRLALQRYLPAPPSVDNPFNEFPDFDASIYSTRVSEDLEEVRLNWVIGQCASWSFAPDLIVLVLLSRVSRPTNH